MKTGLDEKFENSIDIAQYWPKIAIFAHALKIILTNFKNQNILYVGLKAFFMAPTTLVLNDLLSFLLQNMGVAGAQEFRNSRIGQKVAQLKNSSGLGTSNY